MGLNRTGGGGPAGVDVGEGLDDPPLANDGSIQNNSNATVNSEEAFVPNILGGWNRQLEGKSNQERLRNCYLRFPASIRPATIWSANVRETAATATTKDFCC